MKTFLALFLLFAYVSAECLPRGVGNGSSQNSCLLNSGACSDTFDCTQFETCTGTAATATDFEAFADTATRPPGGAYYGQNFCTNIAEGAGDQSCNQPNNCLPGVPIAEPGFCHCLNCVFSQCHLIRPDSVPTMENPLRGCLEPTLDCWRVGDDVLADPVNNGVEAITDCFHVQRPPSVPTDGTTWSGASIHLADGIGRQGSIVKTVDIDCSSVYSLSFWASGFSEQGCPAGAPAGSCDATGVARAKQISRLRVSLTLENEVLERFYHFDSTGWDKTTAPWYFIQVTFRPASRGDMTISFEDVTTAADGIQGWGPMIDDVTLQAFDCCSNTPSCSDNTTVTLPTGDVVVENLCTRDFCSPEVGCINTFELTDGAPCYFTQRAGSPSVCDTLLCGCGICGIGNGNITCSDGDPDTIDTCETGVGCVYTPITCPVPCDRNNVTQVATLNTAQQNMLNYHNAEREDLCLDDLLWDTTLTAQAQTWADNCLFTRSGAAGENIAAAPQFTDPLAVFENWQSGKQWYDCAADNCTAADGACLSWQRFTGENVTSVGCAWSTCPATSNPLGMAAGQWELYVCLYDEPASLGNTEERFCERLDCTLPFNATAPPGLCDPAGCTQPANPAPVGDAAANPDEQAIVDGLNARRQTLCTHDLSIDNTLSTLAANAAGACDFTQTGNVLYYASSNDVVATGDIVTALLSGGASYDCNTNQCTADNPALPQQPATPTCLTWANAVSDQTNNIGCATNTGCPLPLGGNGAIAVCFFDGPGLAPGGMPLQDCSRNVCPQP